MILWIVGAVAVVASFGLVEVILRIRGPYRLWSDAFDEASVIEPHPSRGWAQKKNLNFIFYHRFLAGSNRVHFNGLGMHDRREYVSEKGSGIIRIALFGDTCAAGYELPIDQTIAAQLERQLTGQLSGKNIEVMNASARNYSTAQLYQWYVDELAAFKPDLVIYLFVTNHPRRNITLHESGKPLNMFQPVFRLNSAGGIEKVPAEIPRHSNDLIHLDSNWDVKYIPGQTDRSLYGCIRNSSQFVSFLDDWIYGSTKLRKLTDRSEIKDIEKRTPERENVNHQTRMPYQWQLTKSLLTKWAAAVNERGARFVVAPFLTRYHVGPDNRFENAEIGHPLGFVFDQIPDRRFLPGIIEALDATYFDTYAFARDRNVDTASHYLHPRYAYPTKEGAHFHAEALAKVIVSEISARDAKHGTA